MISIALANVAGGRLVGADGYADADRTADFGRALAGLHPDVLIITELDTRSDQLERLGTAAIPGRRLSYAQQEFSDSHIPGVERLGVGIVSAYPLTELERIDLPDPPIDFLHWRTGAPMDPSVSGSGWWTRSAIRRPRPRPTDGRSTGCSPPRTWSAGTSRWSRFPGQITTSSPAASSAGRRTHLAPAGSASRTSPGRPHIRYGADVDSVDRFQLTLSGIPLSAGTDNRPELFAGKWFRDGQWLVCRR
ncbi:hypothetical protein GCM10009630_58500 [Kribbella jejuensis]|uniref:Endonuclease/exonuclease/phosphatase domain-containing protein n=1 Tax=Kribbella jejuensis TaxID=236068 RepID=A0A542EN85_9ACTN|nr:endonuclease/exonuclease/phosphatase family protein [Kribbella jejuensis]TQJ16808.1 hypothetical protein FB475_0913 [Kribbella jejuensis]